MHKGRETGDEGVLAIVAEKHDFAITYFGTMITAADITELVTSDYGVLPVSEPTIIDASFGRANAGYTKEDCAAIAGDTNIGAKASGAILVSLLFGDGNGTSALDDMKQSLDSRFGGLADVGRGRALERSEDDDAPADYADAIRHDPAPLVAAISYFGQSRIEADRNDLTIVLADCDQAIRPVSNRWFVHVNRGQIFNNEGEYDDPLADCAKACASSPRTLRATTSALDQGNVLRGRISRWQAGGRGSNRRLRVDGMDEPVLPRNPGRGHGRAG